jgi:hypothetical protein
MSLREREVVPLDVDRGERLAADDRDSCAAGRIARERLHRRDRIARHDPSAGPEPGLGERHHQRRRAGAEPGGEVRAEALAAEDVQAVMPAAREMRALVVEDTAIRRRIPGDVAHEVGRARREHELEAGRGVHEAAGPRVDQARDQVRDELRRQCLRLEVMQVALVQSPHRATVRPRVVDVAAEEEQPSAAPPAAVGVREAEQDRFAGAHVTHQLPRVAALRGGQLRMAAAIDVEAARVGEEHPRPPSGRYVRSAARAATGDRGFPCGRRTPRESVALSAYSVSTPKSDDTATALPPGAPPKGSAASRGRERARWRSSGRGDALERFAKARCVTHGRAEVGGSGFS